MTNRVEAAAIALTEICAEAPYRYAVTAIVAADAVMFSDAAVERVAKRLWTEDADRDADGFWDNMLSAERDYYRKMARAVVATLKAEA